MALPRLWLVVTLHSQTSTRSIPLTLLLIQNSWFAATLEQRQECELSWSSGPKLLHIICSYPKLIELRSVSTPRLSTSSATPTTSSIRIQTHFLSCYEHLTSAQISRSQPLEYFQFLSDQRIGKYPMSGATDISKVLKRFTLSHCIFHYLLVRRWAYHEELTTWNPLHETRLNWWKPEVKDLDRQDLLDHIINAVVMPMDQCHLRIGELVQTHLPPWARALQTTDKWFVQSVSWITWSVKDDWSLNHCEHCNDICNPLLQSA